MASENDEVKKLFYELWHQYPNGLTLNKVEKVFRIHHMRKLLVENGFLYAENIYRSPEDENEVYSLGPNGINLIIAWESEKLSKVAITVSIVALAISALTLLRTFFT